MLKMSINIIFFNQTKLMLAALGHNFEHAQQTAGPASIMSVSILYYNYIIIEGRDAVRTYAYIIGIL